MKLVINYDLIDEIRKANTGFNLNRVKSKMLIYWGITVPLDVVTTSLGNPRALGSILFGNAWALFVFGSSELALRNFTKHEANFNLTNLSSQLEKINVYTTPEMIKQAKLYKTQYSILENDEAKKVLEQRKYIMLPTTGYMNNDEISLLQEHNIGSREYVLSMGLPKKKESKVLTLGYKTASN